MEYIKVFENDSAYKTYRDGKDYKKPNVSLDKDTKKVHYNYPLWNANDKPFVDLDLPSGTLWATMNVGASKPSDAGLYFQWGDTVGYTKDQIGTGDGKKFFSWSDYKWRLSGNSLDNIAFTKYKTQGDTLGFEDDAVHVNMGGDWHIPTLEQCQELYKNTTSAWTASDDGVSGVTFTSKNDTSKYIFIPAAGVVWHADFQRINEQGFYCSNTVSNGNVIGSSVYALFFKNDLVGIGYDVTRDNGFLFRGVLG